MTKTAKFALSIIVVGAVVVAGWSAYRHYHALQPNASVSSGISVGFIPKLSANASVVIYNSKNQKVTSVTLAKADSSSADSSLVNATAASRYNIALKPGVYSLRVTSTARAFPPLPDTTVTVSQNKLTEVTFNTGISSL
ncbi:MAG TPA: hypothetical protein VLG13_01370 [Patescibacteria group bacterium]|nr:hypothetical protein [Patescibacteria group bacterium]